MATSIALSPVQLQNKISSLLQELEQKDLQLQAVQRNYLTVSNLLHCRAKEAEASQVSQQSLLEQSQQLKAQLDAVNSRAEAAERELSEGSQLPVENIELRTQLEKLRRDKDEDDRQRLCSQEQISRLKQDLYAAANDQQLLAGQLQEQRDQTQAANATVAKLKQQLEAESAEARATASQLHALKDVLARSMAQQQDTERQLAAWKARSKSAEEVAAADRSNAMKMQQELSSAKGSQANSALKLMELQNSHQQLELKSLNLAEALSAEQGARAELAEEVKDLRLQLAEICRQAEAAEKNARTAALALSKAQYTAAEAQAAQYAAEEARKSADAAAKVAAQRLADALEQAAEERGVAEATQHELQELLASKDAELESWSQQQQSWRFRQLEFMTRVLRGVVELENKISVLDSDCSLFAAAIEHQSQDQQLQMAKQLGRLQRCEEVVQQLDGTGSKLNAALAHLQQQWVAKQQKICASDKGLQVLQKQLEQLEQQLHIATTMERKLRSELEEVKAGRAADQRLAKQEVEQAEAAVAAARASAEAVQNAGAQQQAIIAQLETKVAGNEADAVSLRYQLSAKEHQLATMTSNVNAGHRRLQRSAWAAAEMAGMLERVGALQQQDVAAVMTKLGTVGSAAGRLTTSSRPGTPSGAASTPHSRPSTAGSCADTAVSPGGVSSEDPSGSKQLLEGLGSMQQQMQVLTQAMQQLSGTYPALLQSWQESERVVAGTLAKLLHVEESLASNYTCLACMRVFDAPISVVPCGHNYCKACFAASGDKCSECCGNGASTDKASGFIPAPALERLCAKFDYRIATLKGLQSLLAQRQVQGARTISTAGAS